ncbi:MAG TPA: hypothetical protein VFT16_05075 [Candidatus Saccharimonadales bacterium]|nr:hypothetical protein [Candidatus Saccharimonadales bacterium]
MEKPVSSKRIQLPPIASLVLAGVAFGLACLAASRAIDTGSWLEYGIAAILLGLGIKNIVQFYQARSKK